MMEHIQDDAVILLDKKGNVLNWNKGAEKIKGYIEEEIVGKSFKVFYLPEDRHKHLPEKMIREARETGKASFEGWRIRRDGTVFWGSVLITALHDEKKKVIGFSKITRDLTEHKLTRDKMQQYTSELEFQNRELEQFAYIASHDLQEPLRKIQTFVELLESHVKDEELPRKYFEKIKCSAQRMSELIKDVLDYSKLSAADKLFTDTDLNEVLEKVCNDFELMIEEKKAKIIISPLPVVKGISLQLGQLFSNLLSNALKFCSRPPIVRISAKMLSGSKSKKIAGLKPERDYLHIKFKDNGIGFEQQYALQIFTIFQRLNYKQNYNGTGIGLALCKKIVENHHGCITASGAVNKGATFNIYLPVSGDL
ncbi:MAG: sensor histidine kinase [Bacteroidia bacterium]